MRPTLACATRTHRFLAHRDGRDLPRSARGARARSARRGRNPAAACHACRAGPSRRCGCGRSRSRFFRACPHQPSVEDCFVERTSTGRIVSISRCRDEACLPLLSLTGHHLLLCNERCSGFRPIFVEAVEVRTGFCQPQRTRLPTTALRYEETVLRLLVVAESLFFFSLLCRRRSIISFPYSYSYFRSAGVFVFCTSRHYFPG